jgi:hypothetical protein
MNITIEKETLLSEWFVLAAQLKKIKEEEMAMRKELFEYFFPTPKVGVNRIEIPGGYNLEATYALDRKMDFDKFRELCNTPEAMDMGLIFEDLVDYVPKFLDGAYLKQSPVARVVIDETLVIKPAAPSMKIVGKKVKK